MSRCQPNTHTAQVLAELKALSQVVPNSPLQAEAFWHTIETTLHKHPKVRQAFAEYLVPDQAELVLGDWGFIIGFNPKNRVEEP